MSKFGRVTVTTKLGQLYFQLEQLDYDKSGDRPATLSTEVRWLYHYATALFCSNLLLQNDTQKDHN